jgi:arginyl-tRNA synthetase
MVELPHGKMKSREGTVVDADDLMDEMILTARSMSEELGKLEGYDEKDKERIIRTIGMGALKYFILKVDPKKNMVFDPAESVDFNGNTGPFIQYTYARIRSVLRKAEEQKIAGEMSPGLQPIDKEIDLIKLLARFPDIVESAFTELNPSLIANYSFELAKEYNQFYHDHSILSAETRQQVKFRLVLSDVTARVFRTAFELLGIDVPERM